MLVEINMVLKLSWSHQLTLSLTICGKAFQSFDAHTEKALSPLRFLWDLFSANFPGTEDRRERVGWYSTNSASK